MMPTAEHPVPRTANFFPITSRQGFIIFPVEGVVSLCQNMHDCRYYPISLDKGVTSITSSSWDMGRPADAEAQETRRAGLNSRRVRITWRY